MNGELIITTESDMVRYGLVNDNQQERVFTTTKYSQNGATSTVFLFYDQATGLQQAQNLVNSGGTF